MEMRHTGESTLFVDVSLDPPDAGMGLFTSAAVPEGALICVYYSNDSLSRTQIRSKQHLSRYVLEVHGIIVDAWCPRTKSVLCMAGRSNDPLDPTRANAEFTVWDKHDSNRLILRATRLILPVGDKFL